MDPRARQQHTFEIQQALAAAERYNGWIYENVAPALGPRVLDVGCAIGNITKHFLDRELVVGIDLEPENIRRFLELYGNRPQVKAFAMDFERDYPGPLAGSQFDGIVCCNVMEHLEHDVAALTRFRELLAPKGRVGLLVPALRALFGSMDRTDGHWRRYQKPDLRAKFEQAGFRVDRIFYMNFPGTFGWFLNARVLKREVITPGQVRAYDKLVPAIRFTERWLPVPFGQSLVVHATKI